MKKKSLIYSELSNKQLDVLKELYINEKVNNFSEKELRNFVREIITHQIRNTIGKEEEIEAWEEMSEFFGEQFEQIILEIQAKFQDNEIPQNVQENNQRDRLDLLEKNNIAQEKKDMWED